MGQTRSTDTPEGERQPGGPDWGTSQQRLPGETMSSPGHILSHRRNQDEEGDLTGQRQPKGPRAGMSTFWPKNHRYSGMSAGQHVP